MTLRAARVEAAALAWTEALGYAVLQGPAIAVCESAAERSEGFKRFTMSTHTNLWKQLDAKDPAKGLGVEVEKAWYWYDNWVEEVRKHCRENGDKYK